MKAIFGGAIKKPLMTQVSMRHLNQIVRERNQYSREALEAWQDFINLKGRMDSELTKVSKRNNFLTEELESWKQQVIRSVFASTARRLQFIQFLKFQAFAEQLTKETQDLKVKIEGHKRENRRLTGLIDQHQDDAARLNLRLSGTEKQRDDAFEALVLQQEIAEELERERKRNIKELSALQHTNVTIVRQRDEAQRVVLHLRSLICGQTHHMEHIVRSLNKNELAGYIEEGYEDVSEDVEDENSITSSQKRRDSATLHSQSGIVSLKNESQRPYSRASTLDGNGKPIEGEYMTPEMESRFFNSSHPSKRLSQISLSDVADRQLRDKTDAIAGIIRNISEQCAAAVEGLQLAQDAEHEEIGEKQIGSVSTHSEDGHEQSMHTDASETGDTISEMDHSGYLNPRGRDSSIPPTPDLEHRSSTAMSTVSSSTTGERSSLPHYQSDTIRTKIVESDEEHERSSEAGQSENSPTKQTVGDMILKSLPPRNPKRSRAMV